MFRVYVRFKNKKVAHKTTTESRAVADFALAKLLSMQELVGQPCGIAFNEDGKQLKFFNFEEMPPMESTVMTTDAVFADEENQQVLRTFFVGIASGASFDGKAHQLYLDLDSKRFFVRVAASVASCLDPDQVMLVTQICALCNAPPEEQYTEGKDLNEFGFLDWKEMIFEQLEVRLSMLEDEL